MVTDSLSLSPSLPSSRPWSRYLAESRHWFSSPDLIPTKRVTSTSPTSPLTRPTGSGRAASGERKSGREERGKEREGGGEGGKKEEVSGLEEEAGKEREHTERKMEYLSVEKMESLREEKMEYLSVEKMEPLREEKMEGVREEKMEPLGKEKMEGLSEEKMEGVSEKMEALSEEGSSGAGSPEEEEGVSERGADSRERERERERTSASEVSNKQSSTSNSSGGTASVEMEGKVSWLCRALVIIRFVWELILSSVCGRGVSVCVRVCVCVCVCALLQEGAGNGATKRSPALQEEINRAKKRLEEVSTVLGTALSFTSPSLPPSPAPTTHSWATPQLQWLPAHLIHCHHQPRRQGLTPTLSLPSPLELSEGSRLSPSICPEAALTQTLLE